MFLSDVEIQRAISDGHLRIDPPPMPEQFSACTIDLHIGESVCIPPRPARDYEIRARTIKARPQEVFPKVALGRDFYIEPLQFVLGETLECVTISPDVPLVGWIEGRSGVARHGLLIHCTAPVVHPGWSGPVTLELVNLGPYPVPLAAGDSICQMLFARLGTPTTRPYSKQHRQQPGFTNGGTPVANGSTARSK